MDSVTAKRHSVLDNLKKDLSVGRLEVEVTVSAHKFKIGTINEDLESWADRYISAVNMAAMLTSRRAPRVAAAIISIDDVPVSQLFQFQDDMPKEERKRLEDNPHLLEYWRRDQLMLFLAQEGNRQFIVELYEALIKLEDQRDEARKAIPKV